MSILKYLNFFKNEGKEFRNILVYNSNIFDSNKIDEIGRNCNNITFSFDNAFLVSSLSGKLRYNRSLKFVNSNFVLSRFINSTYDLIIMEKPDNNLINLINQNEFIQYFIILDNSLINISRFDYHNNGIYKRNLTKIIVDVSKEESQYKKDLEQMSALDRIINYSKKRHEKNDHDIKNNEESKMKNSSSINENFSTINVVNLIPHETKYNNKFEITNHDGIIALYMIISNLADFEKYINCKNKLMNQYSNIKSYIVLNGIDTIQFLKNFNDSTFLIKSNMKHDIDFYTSILKNVIKNEYKFNLNLVNEDMFDKDIWDLI